jgi:hypothetical protein
LSVWPAGAPSVIDDFFPLQPCSKQVNNRKGLIRSLLCCLQYILWEFWKHLIYMNGLIPGR